MESRKNGQNHQKKEIIPIVVKEGGSANSQWMTRQQIETETQKPSKMQARKKLMKVVGWVVNKFH
jgi:hypothetical protein